MSHEPMDKDKAAEILADLKERDPDFYAGFTAAMEQVKASDWDDFSAALKFFGLPERASGE